MKKQQLTLTSLQMICLATTFFFIVSLVGSLVTYLVAYPTAAHRDIAHQLSATPPYTKDMETNAAYEALLDIPEATYSATVESVSVVLLLIIFVVSVGYVYHWLHKQRSKQPVTYTALSSAAGGVLASIPVMFVAPYFVGDQFASWVALFDLKDMPLSLTIGIASVSLLTSFVVSFVMTLVVAFIFEQLHNRKRSFVIE